METKSAVVGSAVGMGLSMGVLSAVTQSSGVSDWFFPDLFYKKTNARSKEDYVDAMNESGESAEPILATALALVGGVGGTIWGTPILGSILGTLGNTIGGVLDQLIHAHSSISEVNLRVDAKYA